MHEFEITPSQIARLVLGYLKSEKCDGAYEEFLKSSKYLREIKGRIITRVDHKTLGDFLSEYSHLNILIQERIEETDFYSEHSSATTLVDQLVYLLDFNGGKIRASTPNRSPIHRKLSTSEVGVNTEENCEVRATSLEDLPGNKRTKDKHNNEEVEQKEANLDVLDGDLPNKHQQQETDETNANKNKNTAAQDVEAAIKTIVQKATSDPYFDKVVKEVIGDDADAGGDNNGCANDGNVRFHSSQPQNSLVVNTNNVLMVQTTPATATMGPIDMSKPCYVINSAPQPIFSTGNVLSDQDIMSMPIVVCDDKRDKQGMGQQFIIPASVNQPVTSTYLVNLTPNNDIPSTSIQFYQNDQQKKLKPIREKRRRIVPTTISRPEPVKILPEPPKSETITIQLQEPIVVEDKSAEEQKTTKLLSLCDRVTPSTEAAQTSSTTPRSGSHVRALDFSTPQKVFETEQKKEPKASWDSDLRGLIKSSPEREPAKKKATTAKTRKKKAALNKTAEEGKLIEKALCGGKKKKKKKKEVVENKEDETNKLVLSPSKLNASKRSLVDLTESPDLVEKKTPPSDKSTTAVSTVKRNLAEALQTPMKMDVDCPKTPGFFSPVNNLDTPLTKVLKEQLDGIDLSSIPTPKFPVTPSFAITPSVDPSYVNRPTDYSSSSSYYQPSDNENNRSIEQLIEECNRLERDTKEIPVEKQIHVLNEIRIPPAADLKAVAERMKALNKNVIGRKNLRLVEPADLESSCSTCTSSSSTSSDEDETEESNQTVIAKQTTQRYSLRLRKNASAAVETNNTTETITSILSNIQVKTTLEAVKTHEEILAEMEEKRKRTIEKLENDQQKLDDKRRKVVDKKKPAPAKKPTVRKSRRTKAEALDEEFLKNPASSSTPTMVKTKPEVTKKRAVNEETEKLVDDLKAILNTHVEEEAASKRSAATKRKAERTPARHRRRSSVKKSEGASDDSTSKSKLDVSLDEETEKLLENLCKPKKQKENEANRSVVELERTGETKKMAETQKEQSKTEKLEVDKKVKEQKVFVGKTENRAETKKVESKTGSVGVDKKEHLVSIGKSEKRDETKIEHREKSVEFDRTERKQQLSDGQTEKRDEIVKESKHITGKEQKASLGNTEKTDKIKKVENQKETVASDKTKKGQKVSVGKTKQRHETEKSENKEEPLESDKIKIVSVGKADKSDKTDREGNVSVRSWAKADGTDKEQSVSHGKAAEAIEFNKAPSVSVEKPSTIDEVCKKLSVSGMKTTEADDFKKDQNILVGKLVETSEIDNERGVLDVKTAKIDEFNKEHSVSVRESAKTGEVDKEHNASVGNSVEVDETDKKHTVSIGKPSKADTERNVSNGKTTEIDKFHEERRVSVELLAKPKGTNKEHNVSIGQPVEVGLTGNEHSVSDEKATGVDERSVCINKPVKSGGEEKDRDDKQHRSHVEKVCEKLFGKTLDEDTETDLNTTETEKCPPIAQQFQKLVEDLADTSDESFNKQEQDDAIKAKELERMLFEAEPPHSNSSSETEEAAEKLVSDLKERGIHLVHNKSSPPPQTQPEAVNTTTILQPNNDLDLFESEFSVCLFHRENVHYKHDPYIRPNKKMSDYDFSLLKKEMNATVYLAEFDAEVQKVMTCTPFETLLDIPSKIDVMPKKKPAPKPRKPNPLEMLNKQLDAKNRQLSSSQSPLEGLYDDGKGGGGKTGAATSDGVVVRKKPAKKSSDYKRPRSMSSSHEKKTEEPTRKSSRIKNRRSSEPRPGGSEAVLAAQETELSEVGKTEEVCKDEAEDELMNYAAVGTPEKCLKKRKADEKPEGHHIEKKLKPEKCKELLKDIDVDAFLSHLHGDT